MIKLADQYNVPVIRNVGLAHRFWDEGELYEYIPEDTFEAMAEILRWIASLDQSQQIETEVEL